MGESKRRRTANRGVSDADAHRLMDDIPLALPSNLAEGADGEGMLKGAFRFAGINRRDGRIALEKIAPKTPADKVLALLGLTKGLIHPRTEQANTHLMTGKEIGCAAGCGTCCNQSVDVTIPEAILLAMDLVKEDDHRRAVVRDRATEFAARTEGERFKRPIRCPFLGEDGNCTVYAIRPVICRSYYSDSRNRCEAAFRKLAEGSDGGSIDAFVMPQLLGRANVAALQGLCKDAGLQWGLVTLTEAVSQILEDPSVIDRWSEGQSPFRTLAQEA